MRIIDDAAAYAGLKDYTILDAAKDLRADFVDDAGDLITSEEKDYRLALASDERVQDFIRDVYTAAKEGLSSRELDRLYEKYRDDGLTLDHLRGWNGAWIHEHKDAISGLSGLWMSESEQRKVIELVGKLGRYGEAGEIDVVQNLVKAAKAEDAATRETAARAMAMMYLGENFPNTGAYTYETRDAEGYKDFGSISDDIEGIWKDTSFDANVRLILLDAWVESGKYGDAACRAANELMNCGNLNLELAAIELMGKANFLWASDATDFLTERLKREGAENPLPGSENTDQAGYASMRQACMVAMANAGGYWRLLEIAQAPAHFFNNDQLEGRAEAIASLGVFMDQHPFKYIETKEGALKPLYDQEKIISALGEYATDDRREVRLAAIQSLGDTTNSASALNTLAGIIGTSQDSQSVIVALEAIQNLGIRLDDDVAGIRQAKLATASSITRMIRNLPKQDSHSEWQSVAEKAKQALEWLS